MNRRRYRKPKRNSKLKEIIYKHIEENFKYYMIFLAIFILGLIIGVTVINNSTDSQKNEISNYITNFTTSLKDTNIDSFTILKISIRNNGLLSLALWFMGSTIIGILVVVAIIGFRGFCLGYTISSALAVYGTGKGLFFLICTILLQNIIFIPAIIAMAVSGARFCSSIIKNIRKDNIKIEILRHTIFCFLMTILLLISSLIETYISKNILIFFIKYF